ncbi:MAG: right-handed parallel beta-helix repeat-containing protein, partial [Treponema sp.]|nr:right-handed parallel beta-helix repeat-containing protein [Treponema sp.]
YVSSTSASPAGSDLTGNGTAAKPFATLQKALDVLDGYGAMMEYTINVSGQVLGASQIKSGIHASKITIAGTSAATDKLKGSSSDAVLTINEAIPADISDLTITGGKRGVDIEAGATVTISGCNITDNTTTASVDGAGIYMAADVKPTLTITGGEVSGNSTAGKGAGVCVMSGTFNSTNLEISGNESTGSNGGGIFVSTIGVEGFKMTGGEISGNKAKAGGGADLQCQDAASPLLGGVTISGNQATAGNGGGIFVTSGKYLSIKDCVVINNTATGGNGGGIYNAGTCYIYGSTAIGEEGASSPAESAAGKHSNIATATTGATPTGGNGGGIYNATTLYLGYYKDGDLVKPDNSFDGGVWYNYASIGGGIYNNTGTIYISGGTIKRNGAESGAGGIYNKGTCNFYNGLIDSNSALIGAGVYTAAGSTFKMEGGTISDNTADTTTYGGGGVCASGSFTMSAGTISGNSGQCGGGIWVYGGTASIEAGTISGNEGEKGAGICVSTSGSSNGNVNMTGGKIETNSVSSSGHGGGIFVDAGCSLSVESGEITGNDGGYLGGGVMSLGSVTMSDGTISGNSASIGGGGVCVYDGTFAMSGGSISANTSSSGTGGGVFVYKDTSGSNTYSGVMTMSGGASVPYGTGNDVALVNPIEIGGTITATAPVATIIPMAGYGASVQVLADGAGAVADNYTKFAVANDPSGGIWKISDTGYIYQAGTGGGGITIYDPSGKLGFTLDKTSILGSGTVKVTAVDPTNGDAAIASSELSGWSISAYYGTDAIKTVTTNQYEFTTAYPVGSYTLNVSVTYKGTTYSDAFTVTKSYAGSKAPGAALAVGDIVFADGSATPYSSGLTLTADQKSAAIAVIFYKGTSSDPLGARTLGVGLKHGTSQKWCITSAKGYSKNVTDVQCSATGSSGNYSFTGDIDGSDNLDQIAAFLPTAGVTNDTGTAANYPAFYFAKNYKTTATNLVGTAYESGWWLPSMAEAFQIYKSVATINNVASLCGGSSYSTSGVSATYIISSSQSVSTDNAAFSMKCNGEKVESDKTAYCTAVAVRQF